MNRIAHALVLLVPLLLGSAAVAADSGIQLRTFDGRKIDISEQSHAEPTILLTFSTHDPTATATLRKAEKALRREGVRMVAVNTDGAQERSALKAWVHRNRLKAPVFTDADRQLQSFLATSGPTTLLVDPRGRVAQRWSGWDKSVQAEVLAAAAALPAPSLAEAPEKTPMMDASDWTPPTGSLAPSDDGTEVTVDPEQSGDE
jgi:peroxiredoxin